MEVPFEEGTQLVHAIERSQQRILDASAVSDVETVPPPTTTANANATAAVAVALKGLATTSAHVPLPLFGLDDEGRSGKTPLNNESGPGTSSSGSHSSSSNVPVASLRAGTAGTPTVTPAADSRAESQSRTNLFVSNIPHLLGKNELVDLFSPYGEILSAAVMRNIHTGDSLGTAFVRFATTEQAQAAMEALTGYVLEGRSMVVQWAKRQHDDTPVGEARKKIVKLFVRNIPLDVSDADLTEVFSAFGPVKGVSIHKDTTPNAGRHLERRIAFITFHTDGVAERAAEAIHNTRPFHSCGKIPLMVKLAEDNPRHGRSHNAQSGRSAWGRNGNTNQNNDGSVSRSSPSGSVRSNKSLGISGHGSARGDIRGLGIDTPGGLPGLFSLGTDACGFPGGAFAVFPTMIPQGGVFVPQPVLNVGVGVNGQAMALRTPMFWHQAGSTIPVGVMGQSQSANMGATGGNCSHQGFASVSEGSSSEQQRVDIFSSFAQPPPFPTDPLAGLVDSTGFSFTAPPPAPPPAPAPLSSSAVEVGPVVKDDVEPTMCPHPSSSDVYDADSSLSLDFLENLGAAELCHVTTPSGDEDHRLHAPGSFVPFL
ncbi:RNA-binding protein, putative [Trypanosoma equiperdum]|uniref:RNA-binding protein, putative n=1 Tax=Trypanosoma equiperdum TaxID=5694 RepID=A0A1G4I7J3_TRYEQ|nr:RNA-binding protein, putative [Trypanosoma equiperdum]